MVADLWYVSVRNLQRLAGTVSGPHARLVLTATASVSFFLLAIGSLLLTSTPAQAASGVSIGSSNFGRASNGWFTYSVADITGHKEPGQACSSGTSCYMQIQLQMSDGSLNSVGSAETANFPDPARISLSGSANLPQVSGWRLYIHGSADYYSDWATITDPYPATSVTVAADGTITRAKNGYLTWSLPVSVSGYSQPGGPCSSNGNECHAYLYIRTTHGNYYSVDSKALTYGADYPVRFVLSGSNNSPKIDAWQIIIDGNGGSGRFSPGWTSFDDPMLPVSAVATQKSTYRDGDDALHFDVAARLQGYNQPEAPCASVTSTGCYAILYGRTVAGDTPVLGYQDVPSGVDYPADIHFTGTSGTAMRTLTAVAVAITKQGAGTQDYYLGPWSPLSDVRASELRGGSNPAENACPCTHADPIDSYTGAFSEVWEDLELSGAGPQLSLNRSYSSTPSSLQTYGAFGYGWVSWFDASLRQNEGATEITQENGAQVSFAQNSDGSYTAPSRVLASLKYDSVSKTYTFIRRGTEKLTFDADGRLVNISDLSGNAITVTRDGAGRELSLMSSDGRVVNLTWNESANVVTKATDSAGRSVVYTYNSAGDLAGVQGADGAVTYYTYDGKHRLLSVTKPMGGAVTNTYGSDGRVSAQVDPLGRTTSFVYDGPTATVTRPSGTKIAETYSGGLLVKRVEDAAGSAPRATTYGYDDANNLTSVTDPAQNTTTATYDSAGNVLTRTNALGKVSKFTYNTLNEVLTSTDPLNRKTSSTYNATGQQLTNIDPAGKTKTWTYNSNGTVKSLTDQLGKVTTYTYDTAGRPTGSTDPDGRVRAVNYSSAGFVTSETDPAGKITTTTRDAAGRPLTVKDADGNVTTNSYDADGNLTKVTDARGHDATAVFDKADQKTSATDANGNTTAWTYTPNGKVKTVTDPRGNVTSNGYDAFDQLTTVTDAATQVTKTSYDALGRPLTVTTPSGAVRKSGYDAAGEVTSTTDPLGKVTKYAYDAAGQQTSTTDPLNRVTKQAYSTTGLPTVKTLPGNSTETTAYDPAGHQTSFTNADGLVTSYTWTPGGLLASKTEPGTMTTSYSYDTAGRQKTVTTPDGHVTTTTYSAAGRPTRVHSDVTGSTDTTYSWDANGNRASMSDATGTTSYTYDNGDRLTSTTNGAGKAIGYGYNTADDLTTITYPGTKTVTYGYDAVDQMTSLKDWAGRTSTFTWNGDGQLATQAYANGVTETRTYDTASQLKQLKDTTGSGTVVGTYGYAYDAAGQLTSDTSNDPLGASVAHTYTYDTTSQLATVAGSGATGAATATPGGRLIKLPVGSNSSSTLAYNTKQQVTSLTPTSGTATTYGYDANGSRTTATTGSSATTYGYTAFGDLATVTLPTKTVAYTSDGDHLRQSRTSSGTTKRFLWNTVSDLPLLLDDTDKTYLYGPTSIPIAQIDSTGTPTYLHTDLLGSPRLITSSTGTVLTTRAYTTHGTLAGSSGTTTTNIGYTGNWTDPDTGLTYLRARDYDPTTSQFLTTDPIVDTTRRAYTYANNNPTYVTDPTGLCGSTPTPQIRCAEPPLWAQIALSPATDAVFQAFEGFADGLTFGASGALGDLLSGGQADCVVNKTSGFYQGGSLASLLGPGSGVGLAAKSAVRAGSLVQDASRVGNALDRVAKDRLALQNLAKEAKRSGDISMDEADALTSWAAEQGLNYHAPQIHAPRVGSVPTKFGQTVLHIDVDIIKHIAVRSPE